MRSTLLALAILSIALPALSAELYTPAITHESNFHAVTYCSAINTTSKPMMDVKVSLFDEAGNVMTSLTCLKVAPNAVCTIRDIAAPVVSVYCTMEFQGSRSAMKGSITMLDAASYPGAISLAR